jgi:phosphohistidine phosphatase
MTTQHSQARRRLLLLRHAKSSWSEPNAADFDRPLNERGRNSAPTVGRKLREEKITVDWILASTARRVQETLELLLPAWGWSGQIHWDRQLYLASPETTLQNLSALAEEQWQTILVVGHNPGLSQLSAQLSGESIDLPTAGLAILNGPDMDWPTSLRNRHWHLTAFWQPARGES